MLFIALLSSIRSDKIISFCCRDSTFNASLHSSTLGIPSESALPGTTLVLPHVFLGDGGFPMTTQIMRPFPEGQLSPASRIFNYRLSRARRCIENAFGILAVRWRIFFQPINTKPETVDLIVQATCVLHNFLMSGKAWSGENRYCPAHFADYVDERGALRDGDWRDVLDLSQMATVPLQMRSNRCMKSAEDVRNLFRHYFLNEGSVSWQYTV
jgi:hypothetical protein